MFGRRTERDAADLFGSLNETDDETEENTPRLMMMEKKRIYGSVGNSTMQSQSTSASDIANSIVTRVTTTTNSSSHMPQLRSSPNVNSSPMDKQTACEDLKAFERRLTEVIQQMKPRSRHWQFLLVVTAIGTAIGAYYWIKDPSTKQVAFADSLLDHALFSGSLFVLLILFACGIHKRIIAPKVIGSRCRAVLTEFSMLCDDSGKLILKPRPTNP